MYKVIITGSRKSASPFFFSLFSVRCVTLLKPIQGMRSILPQIDSSGYETQPLKSSPFTRKAAGELKNDISELVLDIAGKVVEKELDASTHKSLIDDFISRVGDE